MNPDAPVGPEWARRQAYDLSLVAGRVRDVEQAQRGRLLPAGDAPADGSIVSYQGGAAWIPAPGAYVAAMYLANSGAPTHTSFAGFQNIADGGGTDTWASYIDKRPSGVSAQCDTATNKRIDIRMTGLYLVTAQVHFVSITDGKLVAVSPGINGATDLVGDGHTGFAGQLKAVYSDVVSLVEGDWLKPAAYQNDSASEAYFTASLRSCGISVAYLGPAS